MHSFYLPPGNLDLIVIAGPDAAKLLQGQLTCDVSALDDPAFTRGALCNNKGRVLATFIVVRQGSSFFLAMTKGLGDVVTQALKKYLPFYKCELRQADGACYGIVGGNSENTAQLAKDTFPVGGHCTNSSAGWVCNLDAKLQQHLVYTREFFEAPAGFVAGTLDAWLVSGLHSGQFPFTVADVEKYTPQDLHLDRNGYVSFTKGCYTGQEIVARMHYRGKLKKRLFLLDAPSAVSPSEPMEILDSEGRVIGSTLKLLSWEGRTYALASLPAEMENIPSPIVKNRAGSEFFPRVF